MSGDAEPTRGRAGRTLVYLREMFPLPVLVPSAIANALGLAWTLQALDGASPLLITWRVAVSAVVVLGFMLLMRLHDEVKDLETDLRLGRAGDPRYKDRPLVRGATLPDDVFALRRLVTALTVVAGLLLSWSGPGRGVLAPSPGSAGEGWGGGSFDLLPLAAFAGCFAFVWLSSRWFFYPPIASNLLLALVTHNPISLAISGVVIAGHAADSGRAPGPWALALLGAVYLPVAAWETSRKVRVPEDETDYVTYSKVLGLPAASLLPAALIAGATACALPLARHLELSPIFQGAIVVACAIVVLACLRLRLAPSRSAAKLQPIAELYALVVGLGLPIALAVARGVRLT